MIRQTVLRSFREPVAIRLGLPSTRFEPASVEYGRIVLIVRRLDDFRAPSPDRDEVYSSSREWMLTTRGI